MNFVENKLPDLVREELVAANLKNPPFSSVHEGYAVLLEEVEEAGQALEEVSVCLRVMWGHIKYDSPKAYEYASKITQHAMHLAAEAIQVAAMAEKFNDIRRI